jgi:hypothetical protein
MTRTHVLKLIAWMRVYRIKTNEQEFFQMAYFYIYGKADPRCQWCFELYMKKGVVPLFVRQFIQAHFTVKGVAK